jgi:hypothetical protein
MVMKNPILFLAAAASLAMASCKVQEDKSTVSRDCTGTYLRINSRDYHICNPEVIATVTAGKEVTARYIKLKACNGSAKDGMICMMYHENEGWIEVKKIK